ncbi:UNVERIFIED_CONTAM: hypothetical protein PYX00_001864 [Menopon gallinae]|uniref:Ras association domain-containing protein 2 n=1 Tax=Menopon gallinae TaxID=328185 RepID=A0AAW2IE44_9NEOP
MWKCHKCGKPVYFAERKQSLGYDWHPECLRCEECQKRLNPGQHAEHKGVPYCHVPCYGALFGPQLFGHGTRVESHTSFGKIENRMYGNTTRSHLEQKLKAFNAFYDGKNGKSCEIRSREVNGRLVLEGALRIYWGVIGMIHLKEDDDQRTVVTIRKRNSLRYSNGQDNDSDLEGSVPDRITLDHTEIVGSDISEIKRNITPCSTLPSRLEPGFCKEWDEVDELLQVERRVDEKEKLYQTLPAGVVLRPSESPDQESSENAGNEERDSGVDSCQDYEKTLQRENSSEIASPDSNASVFPDADDYSCDFERSIESNTLTRSMSGPDSYNFDEVSDDYENLSLKIKNMLRSLSTPEDLKNGLDRTNSFNYSENSYPLGNFPYDDSLKRYLNASYHQTSSDPTTDPPIIFRKQKGSSAIRRRTGKRRSRTKLKRRCSINGHFYNRETSFFTPPHGSQMSVWVTSLVSTTEVINNLLEKYKVDCQPDNFALFVVRDNGEQRRLKDDEYPLLVRVMLGPHEDVTKLFLMDAHNTEEISSDVAQFLNLSIAECQNILDRYEEEEERQAKRIRLKFREMRKRIAERMEELKVRL